MTDWQPDTEMVHRTWFSGLEKKRHAMYVGRNTEVRSCNQCCGGKAISIKNSECMCVCSVWYPG